VVLIVGTVRDTKRDRGEEDEDDDVWSRSPVLRALGHSYMDDPLFGRSPVPPEASAAGQELEAFLAGKVDRVRFENTHGLCVSDPRRIGPDALPPAGFSLSYPTAGRKGRPPPFSLYRSYRMDSETGGAAGTT
jgi:hypothetical protein